MGEVQEQRYLCKICNKSCVSGKSLGGHMRVHLSQIAASKKAKAEIKMEFHGGNDQDGSIQLKETSKNQSKSAPLIKEKSKNWEKNMGSGDVDQNNSYELRENPKKSWRISNPKHGVMKNGASCKECGKEFPSLRALSGHMRSHSIKNKKLHLCKTCGKGFDSMRAMFGHMKSHSKKLRVPDDSADSLSDLENLCPIRRKRSRIRYKSTSNPSCSSLNDSNCDVCEVEDVEEVAMCLMMLSRGVKNWIKSDSVQESESSDDGSVYFGAESSCKSKKFAVDDDDFVCHVEKKMKMSLSTGNLEKNVCEFDDLDLEDEMKIDLQVSDDEQPTVSKLVESEPLNEFAVDLDCANDLRSSVSIKLAELFNSNSCKMGSSCVHESDSKKKLSENKAKDLEILKDFEEEDKIFQSHSTLGGRKMQENSMHFNLLSFSEADSKLDQIEYGDSQLEQKSLGVGTVNVETNKRKEHSCPICFKVFPSGRALGGHKRAHYTRCNESKIEAKAVNQEFDLNFPVAVDEGTAGEVGLNLWWTERNREHETLVLTN
ncbi:hypothetical protein CDL12_20820 [Handroanthus impetiginosus]|uniref:C2H2-type domain-containing protein n=1 Tax=Handroanthus impetiginosus TaxID=429701 RepID=A0A2G9GNP3_9LAMI|nr:hypothetical protein CDL12_20820 [Handroanthus impetiginosus]